MPTFVATESVNMNSQLQREFGDFNHLHLFVHNSKEIFAGGQDQSLNAVVFIDMKSSPGHPFMYSHGHPTGGMISTITVDLNGSEQFKFTGLSTPIVLFEKDIEALHPRAAVELLLEGNVRIFTSGGNNLLLGDPDGHNTFFFNQLSGKNTIAGFSQLDRIAFAFEQPFHSYEEVRNHEHLDSRGHLVIVDPVNPNYTITFPTLDAKAELPASHVLFY